MESNSSDSAYSDLPNVAAVYSYFISLIIVGTTGNLLIVVAFSSDKKLRRVTANIFIAHLAVVNLFTVVTVTPLFIISKHLNYAATKFRNIVYPATITIALESLTVIALNRYLLIRNNRKAYQTLCTGRAIPAVIMALWLFAISNAVPLWINYSRDSGEPDTKDRKNITIYLFINIVPTLIIVPIVNTMSLRTVAKSRMRVADASVPVATNLSTLARKSCESVADEKTTEKTTDGTEISPQNDLGMDELQKDGESKADNTEEFHSNATEGKVETRPKTISLNLNPKLDVDVILQQGLGSSGEAFDIGSASSGQRAVETNSATLEPISETNNTDCDGMDMNTKTRMPSAMSPEAPSNKGNDIKKSNLVQLDKPKILRVGRGELKLIRLMLAMFSLLLISWVPVLIEIFRTFDRTQALRNLFPYVHLIPVFPSIVPYIYLWSNVHFQKVLVNRLRLLRTICCRDNMQSAERPETTFY